MIQNHFDVRSWERVSFGKVVLNKNENTSNPSLEGLSRVVGLEHMDSESLPLVRWSELSELPDGTTFTRRFHAGQVLFGKRRSYQKKVSFPDFNGICSGDILVFESLDVNRMLPNFLPLLVQSDPFMDFAVSTSAGSLSPRTKWSDLSRFEFLLPSLKDQKDIVEIIGAIDQTIESYQHLSPSSYRESIVHELLSAGGDDWTETTLGEIVTLEYGKPLKAENRDGKGFPVFGSAGEVGLHSEPLVNEAPVIVVGRKGTAGAVWWSDLPCSVIDTAYYVMQKMETDIRFLYLVLGYLDLSSLNAQTGVPGLNRDRAYSQDVHLPPLHEQKRIVEILSSMDDVIQSTEQAVADAKALRSSILGEVFGDLSRA